MKRALPVVERLRVRSPCDVPWDAMAPHDDGRHCVQCARVVYDVATMTRAEAVALADALDRGERICRRVSRRRSDGAILTAEGFIVPGAPRPARKLVAMATAGATVLAACANPEVTPATHAKAPHAPLVIAPMPAPPPTAAREEPPALPTHARGEAPDVEIVPPFPAPAVLAPIGPPPPPKKEKPVPPAKAKPVVHDLDVTGGY